MNKGTIQLDGATVQAECVKCASQEIIRVRKSSFERSLGMLLPVRIYRCNDCRKQYTVVQSWKRLVLALSGLFLVIIILLSSTDRSATPVRKIFSLPFSDQTTQQDLQYDSVSSDSGQPRVNTDFDTEITTPLAAEQTPPDTSQSDNKQTLLSNENNSTTQATALQPLTPIIGTPILPTDRSVTEPEVVEPVVEPAAIEPVVVESVIEPKKQPPQTADSPVASPDDRVGGIEDILKLDPSHYIIQISSGKSRAATLQLANHLTATSSSKGPFFIYRSIQQNITWYPLLYGDFSSRSRARRALGALPREIRAQSPFIRKLSTLQNRIK